MAKLVSSRGAELLLSRNRKNFFSLDRDLASPNDELTPRGLAIDDESAEARPDGIELGTPEIVKLIEQALNGKLHATFSLRLGDSAYYLPTTEEVSQILSSTRRERRSWVAERYDCDDFAYVLKAFASSVAYINNELKLGLCCGIIWGKFEWLDEFHACNWFITSDKTFNLIEPQDEKIYPPEKCRGNVTFIAA